jgi:hypothetical protein
MLRLVTLVERFNELERGMPDDWSEARFVLTVDDEGRRERAAALLGPAAPGRRGNRLFFAAARDSAGLQPGAIRRLLTRLDTEGIRGQLELVQSKRAEERKIAERRSLATAWERALAELPSDWTDLYAEVRLDSTDYLDRGALLLAPLNPSRAGDVTTLRFRCARRFGYGVSPPMAARSLQRCDEQGLTGEVEVLRALSDTYPVATQGPVWYVAGRSV